ncbi:MAG: hypothetical protein LBF16_08945 [Pseudomonadales bacterium]|jgi:hypothetical protein|nr:hypothetical protein [Pseudomonadales bacterium]
MTHTSTAFRHTWLFLLILPLGAKAQTLTLFEPTETSTVPQPVALAPSITPGGSQPAFTLRSTSRIGDSYHAVLVNRDGGIVQVAWQAGQSAAVPGYGGFAVTKVAGRAVTLTQSEPCISAPDKGVSCAADNQALLALATSAPAVAQAAPAAVPRPTPQNPFAAVVQAGRQRGNNNNAGIRGVLPRGGGPTFVDQTNGQVVINPFTGQPEVVPPLSPEEQAARAQRQVQRADRLRAFQPRRIDDADIPPGMQRASTPFGDTLVPIQ